MRPLLVASIEHCGTMFTLDLLPGRRVGPFAPCDNDTKRFRHFSEPDNRISELMRECVTIVPLRHPDAVASSWAARGMNLSRLEREWAAITRLAGVFFFPIDATDRDSHLSELARLLGSPLHTDWSPRNSGRLRPATARIKSPNCFTSRFWR